MGIASKNQTVSSGSDNEQYRAVADISPLSALSGLNSDVELSPHIQEKENQDSHAGFTCNMCPQPKKSFMSSIGLIEPMKAWYRLDKPQGGMTFYPSGFHRLIHTKRCKDCSTKIKRWQRSNNVADFTYELSSLSEVLCVAFVTLTKPKQDLGVITEETRKQDLLQFKKMTSNFLRTKKMGEVVLGGYNFFEQTENKKGLHSHVHGIWLMSDYYSQKELQEDWGGRVDIRKVKAHRSIIKYCTKYTSKQTLHGLRLKESFGICRGRAKTAIELELVRMKEEAYSVPDVSVEWGSEDYHTNQRGLTDER